MIRRLAVLALGLASLEAFAQASVSFDVDMSNLMAPELTWSTSPAGASCTASGGWSGDKGDSGSEVMPPIRSSVVFGLECVFAGASMVTATWQNPTTNTDGTPYQDPAATRLIWTRTGNLSAFECLTPGSPPAGVFTTDRPAGQTMHTITGLAAGEWSVAAFAVNQMGLCSNVSNVASRELVGSVTVSDSIGIGVPAAVSGLGVE